MIVLTLSRIPSPNALSATVHLWENYLIGSLFSKLFSLHHPRQVWNHGEMRETCVGRQCRIRSGDDEPAVGKETDCALRQSTAMKEKLDIQL